MVDFELFNGVNLHEEYPGWFEAKGFGTPEYQGGAWYRADVIHKSVTAAITFDYIGLKDDWIISPAFEATETTKVTFMAGLSRIWNEPAQGNFSHNDSVSVLVATEGLNFEHVIHSFKMANQPPWTLEHFDFELGQFAGQVIRVAFYATNGQEANSLGAFHLDDIVIKNATPQDAGVFSLVHPTAESCFVEDMPVVVKIKNDGLEPISSVPVRVRVRGALTQNLFAAYDGVIQPGEFAELTVGTISQPQYGDYTFNISAELPGDGFHQNDHLAGIMRSNPVPKTLPMPKMDFIGFYFDISDIYPEWYEARGKGHPLVAMNTDWQGDNYDGARTANVYFTGLGTEDWLVGPKFTATEHLVVEMRAAVQYESGTTQMGSDDYLGIMVSTDCGESFETVGKINQASGVNPSLQPFSFALPQFDGQDIILALYATTGTVNDPQKYFFHITDLHIKNQFGLDAGVTRLIAPGSACAFTGQEEVVVEVQNFGTQTISNFDVAFVLNDGTPVVETITQTLEYNETLVYTFSTTIDLTQEAENVISVFTMLEDDEYAGNDGLFDLPLVLSSHDLATQGAYTMGFEDHEDFSGWLVEDGNNDGVTWNLVTDGTHANSGQNSFAYFSNQTSVASNDWLISPCFSLQEGATYYVSFFYKNRATNWPESLKLNLGTAQGGDAMDQLIIDLGQISNSAYMKAEATFTVDASGEYYFGWHAYGPADQFGMHIDDVTIYQVFEYDLSATNYIVPRNKDQNCGLQPATTVEVEVTNFGQEDISGFEVGMTLNDGQPMVFDFTQTIASGETLWVTLENGFAIEPDVIYELALWTQHPQDFNTANDTLLVPQYLMAQYHTSFEPTDDVSEWTSLSLAGNRQWHHLNNPSVSRTGDYVYAIRTDGAGGNTGTDDWLFSECFYLEAGTCYEVSFWYRSHFSTENLSLHIGTGQQPADMDEMLINLQGFNTNAYVKATQQFTVEESGVYHFGWHSLRPTTSGAYFIYIDDVSVVEDLDNQPVVDPQYMVLDYEVAFTANGQNVSTYLWDFGDGNTSGEMDPFHVYETPGTFQVSLTADSGCVEVVMNFEVEVELTAYDVSFDVVNQWGNPVAGAVIVLQGQAAAPGVYQFELTQGGYAFTVTHHEYVEYHGNFTVVDQDVTVEVVLISDADTYTVTFQVQDADGNDITGATITFDGETQEAGNYVIENVLPGTYDYLVSYTDFLDADGQVEVVDEDVTVVVTLTSTSISDPQAQGFKVYPNPASDRISVSFEGKAATIRVLNLAGQVMLEQSHDNASGQTHINISSLKPGTYILQIIAEGKVLPAVFIKN